MLSLNVNLHGFSNYFDGMSRLPGKVSRYCFPSKQM